VRTKSWREFRIVEEETTPNETYKSPSPAEYAKKNSLILMLSQEGGLAPAIVESPSTKRG
jgi:hypothetical protein